MGSRADELIDAQVVAELLGLAHRNSVSSYQRRYPDMPRPEVDPGPGRPKLWRRSAVEAWVARLGRVDESRGPMRDPFYAAIVGGLDRELDPRLFEACVVDILYPEIPVVPVSGGDDLGLDGAVFDGEDVAYPLITSTAKDAIGNLTRNLTRYLEVGGGRRLAIFATSRDLSARRRRNLEERARSLGFTLVQIVDRRGIADRLYRQPRWCKELLGIVGDPPALSRVPLSPRPGRVTHVVGREAETQLLRESTSDQLIVGPPGSGKTVVLSQLVESGGALFLASSNRSAIADAIRAQTPSAIIVDDAHARLNDLDSLIHLRTELGGDYRIVASSWPADAHLVARRLAVPEATLITLERLTRDQIVEIIKDAGLKGPSDLLREVVNQAEGLPGLAVTLADICLRAGTRDLVLGNAISGDIRSTIEPRLGARATHVLAALSLGGGAGLTLAAAAAGLGIPIVDARSIAVDLAAAGVLHENREGRLVVRPSALRHALVRDVFFGTTPRLPIDAFLSEAPLEELALTLVEVAGVGGHVSSDLLLGILSEADSPLAWALWARSGPSEANRVIESRAQVALQHPEPFLHWIPDQALRVLFEAADNDHRETGPNPDHPLRRLADWLSDGAFAGSEAITRRQHLVDAIIDWAISHPSSDLPGRVLALVVHPGFESHTTDPGMGLTVSLRWGLLPISALEGIASLWEERIVPFLLEANSFSLLGPVVEAVTEWTYPSIVARADPPAEVTESMSAIADQMLGDLWRLSQGHPALELQLEKLAEGRLFVAQASDPSYRLLFGDLDLKDWEQSRKDRLVEIESLADEWLGIGSLEAVSRFATYEQLAEQVEHKWPRFTPDLASMLAKQVQDPFPWTGEMIDVGLQADILHPFLVRGLEVDADSAWDVIRGLLRVSTYEWMVIQIAVTTPGAPSRLIDEVMERAPRFPRDLFWLAHRRDLLQHTCLLRLLDHPNDDVASSVAIGMWVSGESAPTDPEVVPLWRAAVIRATGERGDGGFWLGRLLASDPDLAARWLGNRLKRSPPPTLVGQNPVDDAIGALDETARRELLGSLTVGLSSAFVARRLVGDSKAVYESLLRNQGLVGLHLAPLWRQPNETWLGLADLALDHGYSVDDVAAAAYQGMHSWTGEESSMWESWIDAFRALDVGEDVSLKAVRERGMELATLRRDLALKREREQQVFGIDWRP